MVKIVFWTHEKNYSYTRIVDETKSLNYINLFLNKYGNKRGAKNNNAKNNNYTTIWKLKNAYIAKEKLVMYIVYPLE